MRNFGIKIIVLSTIFSCNLNNSHKDICEFKSIETLYTIEIGQLGIDSRYKHLVLLKEFSRECMDSLTMVTIALNYIDTVSFNQPVSMIDIFSSKDNFDLSDPAQKWEKVNRNCLVQIWFDVSTRKPKRFVFFKENGARIYEGDRWLKGNLK